MERLLAIYFAGRRRISLVEQVESLASLVTQIRNVSNIEDLMRLLKEVGEIGVQSEAGSKERYTEGQTAKAYDLLAEAYNEAILRIEKDPDLVELKRVAESYKNVVLYWRKQASEIRQEITSQYIQQASEYHSQGNYSESIALYEKALRISTSDPFKSEILVLQGVSYFHNGQSEKALDNYEKALKLNPQNSNAMANIGFVLNSAGNVKESQEYFEKAIEIDPTNAGYLMSAGMGMYDLREYAGARIFLEKALALDPTLWEAWSTLGAVYNDGFSDFQKSTECFKRALSLNPDSLIVKTNLAEILILLKDYTEVEHLLNEVINGTDKPVYGFVSRLLLVIYYFLVSENKQKPSSTIIFDLLSFYETLPVGYIINWCFTNLHKTINDTTSISTHEKNLLNSLLDLKDKVKVEERNAAINSIRLQIFGGIVQHWTKSLFEFIDRGSKKQDDINIKDRVYTTAGQTSNYAWEVFLDAPDTKLSDVSKVVYYLDPTFIKRQFTVTEKEGGFVLKGESWGEFTIKVEIFMKNRRMQTKYHKVTFPAVA